MDNPLIGPPPQEVRLPNAPLAKVLCQVRFPTILAVRKAEADSVISFQEAIRNRYPIFKQEKVSNLTIGPAAEVATETDSIWRFSDKMQAYRASLSSSFASLETDHYESRSIFVDRLGDILEAVESILKPQVSTRVGLRYINRLTGPALANIDGMVRKEVLSLIATSLRPHTKLMFSETHLDAEEGKLVIRLGKLPSGSVPQNLPIEPSGTESWIIDIDMYDDSPGQSFEAARLTEIARVFAERIYSVFRWMVTRDLLLHYGGEL